MQATVLIPAAGSGRRVGAAISKQYLELSGKPILAHTLALFQYHPQIDSIYLIVAAEDQDYCRTRVVEQYGFSKVRRLVIGGRERQDSVRNGLDALAEDGLDEPERPVLIHDGARPLFDNQLLSTLIEVVQQEGACALGVPVKDTIKDVADRKITGSPDRRRLWQAQTPQGFQYRLIRRASDRALEDGFSATDDAALLERLGYPVAMLEGDYRNIKVTTREDLLIAAALLDSLQGESA